MNSKVCTRKNVRREFVSQSVFFKSQVTASGIEFQSWLRVRVAEVASLELKSPPIQLAVNTHAAHCSVEDGAGLTA